jgi:hypothetical protein
MRDSRSCYAARPQASPQGSGRRRRWALVRGPPLPYVANVAKEPGVSKTQPLRMLTSEPVDSLRPAAPAGGGSICDDARPPRKETK